MDESDEGVSFTKRDQPQPEPAADPAAAAEFDPYRFGKPEHPIPAERGPAGRTDFMFYLVTESTEVTR